MSEGIGMRGLFSMRGQAAGKIEAEDGKAAAAGQTGPAGETVAMIGVDDISANPFQPRRFFDEDRLSDLAESLKDRGVFQPLVVRKGNPASGRAYELIAGERRLRAAKMAGLARVPAMVKDVADKDMRLLTLAENLQREDLNVVEKTLSIGSLEEEIGDPGATAIALRLTRRSVERYVRMYKTISASPTLLSLFTRNADVIDFRDAEALANIGRYLRQEDFGRFVDVANSEGIKRAIRRFKSNLGSRLSPRLAAKAGFTSVICTVKETETRVMFQAAYVRGTEIKSEERKRLKRKFEDFLGGPGPE